MESLNQMIWNLFHKKEIEQAKASVKAGDTYVDVSLKEWTVLATGPESVKVRLNEDVKVIGPFVIEPHEGAISYGVFARLLRRVDPAESVEQAMKVMK